jgi:pimeloyl-ACP methyl ester carboxylesterase
MTLLLRAFLCLAVGVLLGCLGSGASAAEPVSRVAVVGVNVLPMTGADRLADQTVLILGDRIEAIGPKGRTKVPPNYRIIDGRGLTLMPGLVDMHVHLANEAGRPGDAAQRALAVMLGHGVTTARSMAGGPNLIGVRAAIEGGSLAGPRLYAAAPALNLNNVTTVEAARKAVAAAKAAGFDLIKSHHIVDVEVWQAVQDEARRQGLPTAGHVSNEIGLSRAFAAGQQVEHLDGALFDLLPPGGAERQVEFGQIPPPEILRAASQATDAQLNALARQAARARSYQVPTLALFEKISNIAVPVEQLLADPNLRFVPPPVRSQWAQQYAQLSQMGFTPEDGASLRAIRRRIVAAYHRAGVPLMAGSDTAQSFHLWGPGLLGEIRALAAAGLTPLEALRTATVVPRNYFRSLPNGGSSIGLKADFGTVEKGARADLILLGGDPSKDLAQLDSLKTVIAAGRVYDRAALDEMLNRAAADAQAPPPARPLVASKQVYVMRHLPPEEGPDPRLGAVGAQQADALATQLQASGIKAIYVTNTNRSRETAAPLAAKLGLIPTVYDPGQPDALVGAIAGQAGNALVVAHSNTVPDIISRLGGAPPAPIGPTDFGVIWQVNGPSGTKQFAVGGPAPALLSACSVPGLHPTAVCGSVRVPENRKAVGGRTLEIRFAVLPAAVKATEAPLVMLPGGPGLGGVQSGPGLDQLFAPIRANRDILMIDQRGTGGSNGLRCPLPEEGGNALERLGGTPPEEVIACRDILAKNADLSLYATREAVLDMEQVRAALGYEKLDLFGMSYGTRVALDYIRVHPERVGETVIRAAAPAAMKLPLWTPRDSQKAYDTLARYCREQPDCAARHPTLDRDLQTILARLKQGPVPISLVDPRTRQKIDTKLDQDGFSSVMFFLLYIPEFYVQLPPLIDSAAKGNFSPMVQAVAPVLLGTTDQVAWGMRWSVICDEDVRRIKPNTIASATKGTFMGARSVTSEIEACALWPKASIPKDYFAPVRSDKPVFIISGAMDPVAGKLWGDEIAKTLPNSVHVEVDGASHLPPFPGCTIELVGQFLDGKSLRSLDLGCVGQIKRPKLKVAA